VLAPTSEHAEDDSGKEGEGDDGCKHVEPHPKFHLSFLCRKEPALSRRVCGDEGWNLRSLGAAAKQNSVLQRINISATL
jgi:hypothetical protein